MGPQKPSTKASKRTSDGKAAKPLWDSDEDLKPADLDLSSSSDEENDDEEEFNDALMEYMEAARRHTARRQTKEEENGSGPNNQKQKGKASRKVSILAEDEAEEADTESGDEDEEEAEDGYNTEEEEGEGDDFNDLVASDSEDDEEIEEDISPVVTDTDEEEQANGGFNGEDAASDSSEDERPNRNTIGDVPLQWYKAEEHIGYDVEGQKLGKKGRRDALERLLARNDSAKEFRTVYDEYNDEEIVLSKEEMRMIQRIRAGKFAHVEVNPFEPENDWFSRETEIMPLSGAPEPKSRFIPSKWEEKRVVKLVRAMRKGWLKRTEPEEAPSVYMMWNDDGKTSDKTATGLTYIAAPKMKLPGHEESYNPPAEYLPTEEERNAALLEAEAEGERPPLLPQIFESLRKVPAYGDFIRERFERCLDLYLCPRARIKRLNVDDPESLVPKLPKPKDLQPFPTSLALSFTGHKGQVRSVSTDSSGQYLVSGSADGTVRLWEVRTARCLEIWNLGEPIACVAWCLNSGLSLLAVAAGSRVVLLATGKGNEEQERQTNAALERAVSSYQANTNGVAEDEADKDGLAKPTTQLAVWKTLNTLQTPAIELVHRFPVKSVQWHARGNYFCTTAPSGNTRAVLVHQLSRGATQNPFRKNRGRVVTALFHPTKPFFFVATQQAVRVYNLAKQVLAKKLLGGSGVITSMDLHPSGDHLIVGSEDRRLCWYDLDLSSKPYRALRYHSHAVRGAAYHKSYPLFASASDDASVHIFHGMVYNDLLTNPLIVPVKILRGHERKNGAGVMDVVFHPTQPWVFTAGADGVVKLFVNP